MNIARGRVARERETGGTCRTRCLIEKYTKKIGWEILWEEATWNTWALFEDIIKSFGQKFGCVDSINFYPRRALVNTVMKLWAL